MSALERLQRQFQDHVLHGDISVVVAISARGPLLAPARLGIYHHAYRARLADALRDSYGHTATWLGEDFDVLAGGYIESHGSAHASLRSYGRDFPEWLAAAASGRTAIAELAMLDRALRDAFDCADSPVVRLADLAAIDPAAWDAAVIVTSHCERLRLRRDTLALWRSIDEGNPAMPPAGADAVHILVWRRGVQPHFRSVGAFEWAALDEVLCARSFGESCARLADAFPQADVASEMGALLRRWVDEGLIAAIDKRIPVKTSQIR